MQALTSLRKGLKAVVLSPDTEVICTSDCRHIPLPYFLDPSRLVVYHDSSACRRIVCAFGYFASALPEGVCR
jgi:hypothetical protein